MSWKYRKEFLKRSLWAAFCFKIAVEITIVDNTANKDQPCRKQREVQMQVLKDYLSLEEEKKQLRKPKEEHSEKKYSEEENFKRILKNLKRS